MYQTELFKNLVTTSCPATPKPGRAVAPGDRRERCRFYIEATCRPDEPEECERCTARGRRKRAKFPSLMPMFHRAAADSFDYAKIKTALRALYTTAKITKDANREDILKHLVNECDSPIKLTWRSAFSDLIEDLSAYVPGFSRDSWEVYRDKIRGIRSERSGLIGYWKRDDNGDRIFNRRRIDNEKIREEWAKAVYAKRGKPTFGKKIITGACFGAPSTAKYRNGGIHHRWVGVSIGRRENGHLFVDIKIQS